MIRYYTREAGVRNLEREIAKLARKAVTEILQGQDQEGRRRRPTSSRNILGVQTLPLWSGREGRSGRCRDRSGLDLRRR